MDKKAIGIMGSGLGGLTVMKELMKQLPNEELIYLGDTKHCPYGEKTPQELVQYVNEIADFLVAKGIKMLVLACNTATVVALAALQERLAIPVIGMLEPASIAALQATSQMNIGVIATQATVRTKKYTQTLQEINPDVRVVERACPAFVTLVEQGLSHTKEAYAVAYEDLQIFRKKQVDTLILGCTHFPMMKESIQKAVGQAKLIDPAFLVAQTVAQTIKQKDLQNNIQNPKHQIYITKEEPLFEELANLWLQSEFEVKVVDVDAKR